MEIRVAYYFSLSTLLNVSLMSFTLAPTACRGIFKSRAWATAVKQPVSRQRHTQAFAPPLRNCRAGAVLFPNHRPNPSFPRFFPSNHARTYRWIAEQQNTLPDKDKKNAGQSPVITGTPNLGDSDKHVTNAEQRQKDWDIIRKLMVNIWPKGEWGVKARVLIGFGFLVAGKVRSPIHGTRAL